MILEWVGRIVVSDKSTCVHTYIIRDWYCIRKCYEDTEKLQKNRSSVNAKFCVYLDESGKNRERYFRVHDIRIPSIAY